MRAAGRLLTALCVAAMLGAPAAGAAELEYIETLSKGADAAAPLPIVVAMHGLGDRPEEFRLLLDDLPARARIIYARAPRPYGNDGGGAWFEMHRGDEDISAGVSAAVEEVAALIKTLHEKHGGPERVVVTGFSQGGILSFALAAAHPEMVAAAIPVGGYLPVPMWPAQRPKVKPLPRVLALHGEKDPVVPIQQAKWSVEALRSNGFEVQLRSYPDLGHTIARDERADLHQAIVAAVTELAPELQQQPEAEKQAAEAAARSEPVGQAPVRDDAPAVAQPQTAAPAPDAATPPAAVAP